MNTKNTIFKLAIQMLLAGYLQDEDCHLIEGIALLREVADDHDIQK
jgi:hypothetical protein